MLKEVASHIIRPMSMEHDGLSVSLNSHSFILSLSIFRFFFDEIDQASGEKKFLKPSGIWKKSRNILTLPFASDQEPVRAAEEMRLKRLFEKA